MATLWCLHVGFFLISLLAMLQMASVRGHRLLALGRSLVTPTARGVAPITTTPTRGSEEQPEKKEPPKPKTNLAIQDYMDRKLAHDHFISQERSAFELGKKHLANMMGMSAEDMTQDDVDKAIQYLFPSGLTEPKARPLLRPPEDIFPKQKDAEFNSEGRPFNPFFFTAKAQYTQSLYDIVTNLDACTALAARMRTQGVHEELDLSLRDERNLSASRWLTQTELSEVLRETVKDNDYTELIVALTRLVGMPFSYKFKDFIWKFRVEAESLQSRHEMVEPETDENGNAFVEAIGQRKSGLAKVRVTKPGTGKFSLTHIDYPDHVQDITYFYGMDDRNQILFPLQFTNLLGRVDVDAVVSNHGGPTGHAGSIRYALAMCLRSFVDEEKLNEMTVVGLITQDIAVRERHKPGLLGARRRRHFRKR